MTVCVRLHDPKQIMIQIIEGKEKMLQCMSFIPFKNSEQRLSSFSGAISEITVIFESDRHVSNNDMEIKIVNSVGIQILCLKNIRESHIK